MNKFLPMSLIFSSMGLGIANAEEAQVHNVSAGMSTIEEPEQCLIQTASFEGIFTDKSLEADVRLDIEEDFGAILPDNMPVATITYSFCGSDGHAVTENLDRQWIFGLLNDGVSLDTGAKDAFKAAWEGFKDIPCSLNEVHWIGRIVDGPDEDIPAYLNRVCPILDEEAHTLLEPLLINQ